MTQGKRDLEQEEHEEQVLCAEESYRRGLLAAALLASGWGEPNEKMVRQSHKHHKRSLHLLRKRFGGHIRDGYGCTHEELATYRGFRDGLDSAYILWWMLTDSGRKEYSFLILEWVSEVRRWRKDISRIDAPLVDNVDYIRKVASVYGIDGVDSWFVKPWRGMIRVGSGRNARMICVRATGRYGKQDDGSCRNAE